MIGVHEVRQRATMALAPDADTDPQVVGLTDAVVAPCLQVAWAQPWLLPAGQLQVPVAMYARLGLLLIGGRVDATGALDELEHLAAFAVYRLARDALPWSVQEVTAPRGTTIGGVEYLVARAVVQVAVDCSKVPEPAPLEGVA